MLAGQTCRVETYSGQGSRAERCGCRSPQGVKARSSHLKGGGAGYKGGSHCPSDLQSSQILCCRVAIFPLPAPSPYPPLLPRLHLPSLSSAHLRNVACRAPLNWPPLLATPVLPPLLCPPPPHPPPPLTCGTLRASCSPCGPPEQTRTRSRRGERTARAHLHNVCVWGGGGAEGSPYPGEGQPRSGQHRAA